MFKYKLTVIIFFRHGSDSLENFIGEVSAHLKDLKVTSVKEVLDQLLDALTKFECYLNFGTIENVLRA